MISSNPVGNTGTIQTTERSVMKLNLNWNREHMIRLVLRCRCWCCRWRFGLVVRRRQRRRWQITARPTRQPAGRWRCALLGRWWWWCCGCWCCWWWLWTNKRVKIDGALANVFSGFCCSLGWCLICAHAGISRMGTRPLWRCLTSDVFTVKIVERSFAQRSLTNRLNVIDHVYGVYIRLLSAPVWSERFYVPLICIDIRSVSLLVKWPKRFVASAVFRVFCNGIKYQWSYGN